MSIELPLWHFLLIGVITALLIMFGNSRPVLLSVIAVYAVLLIGGCASTPDPEPKPPPLPAPILCAAPAGMTQAESPPEIPRGEITQRDVAVYLLDLHRWGSRGWLRLAGVRAHAQQCASNARPTDLYTAIQEH